MPFASRTLSTGIGSRAMPGIQKTSYAMPWQAPKWKKFKNPTPVKNWLRDSRNFEETTSKTVHPRTPGKWILR
jgi:hypothetical protein